MAEKVEDFINRYAFTKFGQKANQSRIIFCVQTSTCIAEFTFDRRYVTESQEQLFKSIIRRLYETQNNYHHFVRIKEIHDKINQNDRYAISMELGECDLEDELIANPSKSLFEIVAISYQLCQSIEDVHHLEIIHTDVKLSNFIKFQDVIRTQYKLADFGISQYFSTLPKSQSGTIKAPEQSAKDYDKKVDVFALGILFYQMITGERNCQVSQQEVSEKVKPINEQYANIVKGLVQSDPQQRFEIQHVMKKLQELLNTIQGVTLFGLIKLTFKQDDQSKQWLVNDDFDNKYNVFKIRQLRDETFPIYYVNQKYIRKKQDTYNTFYFESPHIFNAELQISIKVDEYLDAILIKFNDDNVSEREFIRLILLMSNLQQTTRRMEISGKELNFCIDNSCKKSYQLLQDQQINYKQALSLILYYFYSPNENRLQKVSYIKYDEQAIQNLIHVIKNKMDMTKYQQIQIEDILGHNDKEKISIIQKVKNNYYHLTVEQRNYIISQIIAKSINRNVLINKIINNQKLSNLDLTWLYDDQKGIIQNVQINQYICVDKNNGFFVFARKQQESNWEQIGIDIFKQPLITESIDQKQITNATENMVDKYICQMILLSEYNELKQQKKHLTSVEDGFLLYKVNQDYKFKIHFLDQAIQDSSIDEHEKEKQETDSLTRMCDYLNKINDPKSKYTTFDQQFRYVFNQMVWLSVSASPIINKIKESLTQENENNPPDFQSFRSLVLVSTQTSTHNEQLSSQLISVSNYATQVGGKLSEKKKQVQKEFENDANLESLPIFRQNLDSQQIETSLKNQSKQQQQSIEVIGLPQVQKWLKEHRQGETISKQYQYETCFIQQLQSIQVIQFQAKPSQQSIQYMKDLKDIKHAYCINIIEIFQSEQSFTIITELTYEILLEELKKGELKVLFTKITIMYQMALSLQDLHQKELSHQDIKLENFVKVKLDKNVFYKLTGFYKCGPKVGMDNDVVRLCYIFYLMLTNRYNTDLDVSKLEKGINIDELQKVSSHIGGLIQVLKLSSTENIPTIQQIIETLKSVLQKVPELYFFKCFKVVFSDDDLIDNFGNTYNAYLIHYKLLGENQPRQTSKGQLNSPDDCIKFNIKFNIGNPISNFKATIVLKLDNFILINLKFFKHLKFPQIMDIVAALTQQNYQSISQQQLQQLMSSKTAQSINYEQKDYSVKMLISQMVLLHYYININLLISDKEQKGLKEFDNFVEKNRQFFK